MIPEIIQTLVRSLLQLTLYDMIRSSRDFEDVKAALNERTTWTIDVLRSVFSIRLANGGYFVTLCSLMALFMAENMHLHYGRLAPGELKERVDNMGHATFAILIATLDFGVVVIRVAGIFALCGSSWLATCLIFVCISPTIIVPLLIYLVKSFRRRTRQPTIEQGEEGVAEQK
ncbi:hypothetical protein BU15DRAFT_77808 [Melanogaster broomeanus]|nr:hypothetical protein BU15DRAFT_77808 [Melanogaster broomeanus]